MFKQIKIPNVVFEMAQDIERKKKRKIEKLFEEYIKADVLFLHLNDYPAFRKVLPSKLFEYAATGKPIWAGLDGYSSDFVKSEITGCEVFLPGDVADAIDKFSCLTLGTVSRTNFIKKFSRKKITAEMALDIIHFVKQYG